MVYFTKLKSERPTYLFESTKLEQALESQKSNILSKISELSEIPTDIDGYVQQLVNTIGFEIPIIDENSIIANNEDIQLDVSGEFNRDTDGRTGPFYYPGTKYIFELLFEGDATVFQLDTQVMRLNHGPIGKIHNDKIVIELFTASDTNEPEEVKKTFESQLKKIRENLASISSSIEEFKKALPIELTALIERRSAKLSSDRKSLESLGYPSKRDNKTEE